MTDSPRPLRVALTGGIASGKTAVANEFARLGVPIIDADQLARDVVAPGSPALEQIAAAFGSDVLDVDGQLDRRKLREVIFADATRRKQLEDITHPAIRTEFERRSLSAGGDYQIHAIPLLAEGGRAAAYDRVLVVDCPEETQVLRLMQRDGVDEIQARRALAAQASRQQRLAIADDVIENMGTLDQLRSRVASLHSAYRELARQQHDSR